MSDEINWPYLTKNAKKTATALANFMDTASYASFRLAIHPFQGKEMPQLLESYGLRQHIIEHDIAMDDSFLAAIFELDSAGLVVLERSDERHHRLKLTPALRRAVAQDFHPLPRLGSDVSTDELATRIAELLTPAVLDSVSRIEPGLHLALATMRDEILSAVDEASKKSSIEKFFDHLDKATMVHTVGMSALAIVNFVATSVR